MMTFKTRFDGVLITKDTRVLLRRFHLEPGGLVQQTIDKCVIDYDLQYAPWETGTMAKSPYIATHIGSGKIIYEGPYAHYLYYGQVYGPNIPVFEDDSGIPTRYWSPPVKHPTGRALKYSKDVNPLAGPFWFERMKADRLNDILEEAKRAAFQGE